MLTFTTVDVCVVFECLSFNCITACDDCDMLSVSLYSGIVLFLCIYCFLSVFFTGLHLSSLFHMRSLALQHKGGG